MSLPKLAGYSLPNELELPQNRVNWTLSRDRTALLIHDMQEYFLDAFPEGAPPIAQITGNIARLRKRCAELAIPVFYTAQKGNQYPADRGLQADFWGPGMRIGPHAAIIPPLTPAENDFVLEKHRYSAFQRSNLEHLMRARKRDQIIITGVYAHIGCLVTAADAFMRDIQPFVAADAVAAFSRQKHDLALDCITASFGAVMTTDSMLATLGSGEGTHGSNS